MINLDKPKKIPLFIYIVVIPMLIVSCYYAFFAVDRYVSVSKVVVRQPQDGQAANVPSLALLMGGSSATSREETLFLQEFIQSKDMMEHLESELGWVKVYSEQATDPLYLLSPDASAENLLKFYNRIVTLHYDAMTGLLEIEVQGPTPELARSMLQHIIVHSEQFVNEISHSIARDQMKFFDIELQNARRAYEEKKTDLIVFQSANNILDANSLAQSRSEIISGLETLLTSARANLKGLQANLNESSPQIRQLRSKINALERQLAAEQKLLVSAVDGEQLNVLASNFRNLNIDLTIAEESYKLAVTAVENARIEASKKIRSLVTVVSPNLPQSAIYPDRPYNLATIFVLLMLLYGIARFVIASIEDHRD